MMTVMCETKGGEVGVVGVKGCVVCMRYIFFSSCERRCERTSGGFTFLCTFVSGFITTVYHVSAKLTFDLFSGTCEILRAVLGVRFSINFSIRLAVLLSSFSVTTTRYFSVHTQSPVPFLEQADVMSFARM